MSDSEDTTCPLCMEEMDLIDRNFVPCPCGYRVCMWCWHHIRENLNGLCPACRVPYKEDPHAFAAVDSTEVVKKNKERKQKEKQERKVSDRPPPNKVQPIDRKHLHNYRVVQRNLVYIIGIPGSIASEETLRKAEYFGQYGRINKVVVHRNHTSSHATVSAYITFAFKDDAKAAIQALEGFWLEGHQMRASFGTTKYCNNFIRGVPCNNPECVYLHELGEDEDRFTKEEIQAGYSKLPQQPGRDQTIVTGAGGPSGTGKRISGDPILPPPVFVQDLIVAERNSRSRSSGNIAAGSSATSGSNGPGEIDEDNQSTPSAATPQTDGPAAIVVQVSQPQGKSISKKGGGDPKSGAGTILAPSTTREASSSNSGGASSMSPQATGVVANGPVKSSQQQQSNRSSGTTVPPLQKGVTTKASGSSNADESKFQEAANIQQTTQKEGKGVKPQRNGSDRSINSSSNGTAGESTSTKIASASATEPAAATAKDLTSKTTQEATRSESVNGSSGSAAASDQNLVSGADDSSPVAPTNGAPSASLSISNLVSPSAFNGLGNCAVFPVPVSSLTVSIWSNLLAGSSDDLKMNPYALISIPVTELFELTIPPVDAMCLSVWPRPLSHYSQGVGANGLTCGPAGQHTFHRSSSSQHLPASESSATSVPPAGPKNSFPGHAAGSTNSVAPALSQKTQQTHHMPVQQLYQQQPGPYMNAGGGRGQPSNGMLPPAQLSQPQPQQPTIAALQQMFPGVNMAFGPPKTGQQQQTSYNTSSAHR